jgi:hypothetical protein
VAFDWCVFVHLFHQDTRGTKIALYFPGRVAEQMGDLEHAITAYENALRHNPMSLPGLTQVAGIARIKENYPKVGKEFMPILFRSPIPSEDIQAVAGVIALCPSFFLSQIQSRSTRARLLTHLFPI